MKLETDNKQRGFATLEMLIAMVIIVLSISAVILLVFSNQSVSVGIQTNQEALYKAKDALEIARANANLDFNLVNPSGPVADDIYQKSLNVQQVDFWTKKVTSFVSWNAGSLNPSVQLTTMLTNPGGISTGDTCSSVLLGNWKNPQMIAYEFGKDIVGDSSSGFPINDIDVYGGKMYVVVNNSNGNNFPTFFVLNISNPDNTPAVLISIDNDPTVKTGLNAISVSGQYAYAANGLGPAKGQLQIIDLDQSPPKVITTFKVPGVTGSGSQAIGKSIFYKDGYVYLGLAKTATGPEFNIIDVSNPSTPVWKGGYSVNNAVNAILVKDDYAYIATPNNEEFTTLDVNNKTNPARAGGYNAPDNQGNGKSIFLAGNTLYLGRTVTSANPEFYIFDNFNPNITLGPPLGVKEISSSVNGIIIRDYLAFLLTNSNFEIWDISNFASVTQYAPPLALPAGSGTSVDCEGNYLFFASLPQNDKGYIAVVKAGL